MSIGKKKLLIFNCFSFSFSFSGSSREWDCGMGAEDGSAIAPGDGKWGKDVVVKGQGGGGLGCVGGIGQSHTGGLITWACVVTVGLVDGITTVGATISATDGGGEGEVATPILVNGGGRGGGMEVATDLWFTLGGGDGWEGADFLLVVRGRGGGGGVVAGICCL